MKENSKLSNGGFSKWLEILAGEDLPTKLLMSENVDLKLSVSNGTAKANAFNKRQRLQRPQICKEAATKYYNYTPIETDEGREHRLPTFQQNAGSENYTICKMYMGKIFQTD